MMPNIKFSVSMCTYKKDNPQWLKVAIESIIGGTVCPNEVILVVDGPIPTELDEIVSFYETNPIFKVIRLEKNVGHGEARRIGLNNCTNELVALMDADDISVPERFEKQVECFQNDADVAIVGGDIIEFIDSIDNVVGKRIVPATDAEIKEYLKKRCPMNQVTVMFKKSCVESVGGYVDWFCEEDYYLWLRMHLAGMKFANTGDLLVYVRVGKEMYNRRGGIRYFKSEAKLQKYMLDHKIIGESTYWANILKRLIVQVLLPNCIRGWVFKAFAREKV